jgi:hypothetical protein
MIGLVAELRTRRMPIVAQDPGIRWGRKSLASRVSVSWEDLEAALSGHRVHVIDYDSSTGTMYAPARLGDGDVPDPAGA